MQGVNPIGPQIHFSPPHVALDMTHATQKATSVQRSVHLAALEKGPETAPVVQKSEFALSMMQQMGLERTDATLDLQKTLQGLREKMQSSSLDTQKEAVEGFARLSRNPTESVRNMGMTGLLSMLRQSSASPILAASAYNLLLMIDPSNLQDDFGDIIRFIFSILETVSDKYSDLPRTQQVRIVKQLETVAQRITQPEIREAIRSFLDAPGALSAKQPTVPPTIVPDKQTLSVQPEGRNVLNMLQKQQELIDKLAHMDPANLEAMASVFSNARIGLLQTYAPFMDTDTMSIYALLYLDTVSKEIEKYRKRKRQKSIAFVVHHSAVLPKAILEKYPLFVIKETQDTGMKAYYDLFASILSQGYKQIVALMPHSEHWLSYHHAKHAAHRMEDVVHVIDTGLFGLGLGLLVHEICMHAFGIRSMKALLTFITRTNAAVRYWVVPLTPGAMKNQLWYQKMNRKEVIYDSAWEQRIPLVSFGHKGMVLSRSDTPTRALLNLQAVIVAEKKVPIKLVVEHKELLPEANAIARYFQQQFPHCEIVIASTSPYLGQEWGPFIGVAALYA